MMKTIKLRSQTSSYEIVTGKNLLKSLGQLLPKKPKGTKVLIVTNKKIATIFLKQIKASLKRAGYITFVFLTPYGTEKDKTNQVLAELWASMAEIPLERGSMVIALGGGVIGDLAGFAASTYMRGIDVIQAPTTLLAQVDSAIGGKTAIDLPAAKNLIGAFHQPRKVVMDVMALRSMTLSREGKIHLRDSFAEVIKYGIISDPGLFAILEKSGKVYDDLFQGRFQAKQIAFLEQVIWRCASAKSKIVSADEFETQGKRIMLNLGHTFAHGFETAAGYKLSHGAAVAIGIACASRLGESLKLLSAVDAARIIDLLKRYGLPTSIRGLKLDFKKVIHAIERDKKKKAGKLRFVVPVKIGKTIVRDGISPELIGKCM